MTTTGTNTSTWYTGFGMVTSTPKKNYDNFKINTNVANITCCCILCPVCKSPGKCCNADIPKVNNVATQCLLINPNLENKRKCSVFEKETEVVQSEFEQYDDPDDIAVHIAAYQPPNGEEIMESINDKRQWIFNNCKWVKCLISEVEDSLHCVSDPNSLDRMLDRMNLAKDTLVNSNIEYLPKRSKIDRFVMRKKRTM